MTTPKLGPLPISTVINIETGSRRDAAMKESFGDIWLYWIENLRKDGRPNESRRHDATLIDATNQYGKFALYDEQRDWEREVKAAAIRAQIRAKQTELIRLQQSLTAVYITESGLASVPLAGPVGPGQERMP